ncbi:helix-turn-helix domain-containing protein [Methylobacterium sp. 10]|uniref:helix-turn-helix domain-containing protein n=1 Tax=Methylobacterium sp. 10 TaxID=1101191 RepID=UPI0004B53AAC|nr:helix-turn-helix domain-containing protein [Methylobacterium sp. 10]
MKTETDTALAKRFYTVAEFMAAYGISRTRTYREIGEGRLIARRIGGRTMITRDDAEAWLSAIPVHRPLTLAETMRAA